MSNVPDQIMRYLKSHSSKDSPVSTTKLAELFPTDSRTSINYYLKKLESAGKVRRYKYNSATGSVLWYVPSTKQGSTLVFEVLGKEISWKEIINSLSSEQSNPYAFDLGNIMNYIGIISRTPSEKGAREKMHNELSSVKERLTVLSARVGMMKGIIDALRNDPALRDPDTLRELNLEGIEWPK